MTNGFQKCVSKSQSKARRSWPDDLTPRKKPRATYALGCGFVVGREGVEPSTLGLRVDRKIGTLPPDLQHTSSTEENAEDLEKAEQKPTNKRANRSITHHMFGKPGKAGTRGRARRCWRNESPLCESMLINSIKHVSNMTFQHCPVEVSCGMA